MSKLAHGNQETMDEIERSAIAADERGARDEPPTAAHTPGPWEYIPSNQNHGPYVTSFWGSDIADCYTMSNLRDAAVCNGGESKPIPFQHEKADANARLIAAAPDMLAALREYVEADDAVSRTITGPRDENDKAINRLIDARSLAVAAITKATGA